jgi:hypothetical protein
MEEANGIFVKWMKNEMYAIMEREKYPCRDQYFQRARPILENLAYNEVALTQRKEIADNCLDRRALSPATPLPDEINVFARNVAVALKDAKVIAKADYYHLNKFVRRCSDDRDDRNDKTHSEAQMKIVKLITDENAKDEMEEIAAEGENEEASDQFKQVLLALDSLKIPIKT